MTGLRFLRPIAIAAFAMFAVGTRAYADTVVYNDTSTLVGAFVFNGAATVGSDLAANVDINQLTLAPGSAGLAITSISFQEANFNAAAVSARGIFYVWADNGTSGLPGTLLASLYLPLMTLGGLTAQTVTYTLSSNSLIVPGDGVIYVGFGYDNDNGASAITAAQLNNLGGQTFYPATVGTAGNQAYFVSPGGAGSNPSVNAFGSPGTADYGFTVTAAPTPEPSSILLLGTGMLGLAGVVRRRLR